MENTDISKKTSNKFRIKKKLFQVNKLNTCSYFGIFDCTCCKTTNRNNNKSSLSNRKNKICDSTTENKPSASSAEAKDDSKRTVEESRNEPSTSTSKVSDDSVEKERKMKEHEEEYMIRSESAASSSTDLRLEVDREEEEIDVVNGSLEDLNNLFQLTENPTKTNEKSDQQTSNQMNIEPIPENVQEEIDVVGLNDIPSVSTINSHKRTRNQEQEQSENELEEEIDVVNLPFTENNENITSNTTTHKPKRKKSNTNMTNSTEEEMIDVVNLTEDSPPDLALLSNALVNSNRELRSKRKERNPVINLVNTTIIEITDSPVAPRVISGVINIDDDDNSPNKSEKTSPSWGNCPVCFEDLSKCQIMSTMCGHVFCATCIKTVIKNAKKCPKCRKNLTLKMVHPLFF